jgi:hypothetical protein
VCPAFPIVILPPVTFVNKLETPDCDPRIAIGPTCPVFPIVILPVVTLLNKVDGEMLDP